MERKFINLANGQLAYVEQHADSENTIFLIHGNSASSRFWHKQFQDPILSKYRLIAIDLPGHGASSSLTDPENYHVIALGKIMADALNRLVPHGKYILGGISLGTNIAAEMLLHAVNPVGLFLTGSCLLGGDYTAEKVFKSGVDLSFLFTDDCSRDAVKKGFSEVIPSIGEKDLELIMEDYFLVKAPFRSTLLKTVTTGIFSNEIDIVRKYTNQCLVIFGKDEKAVYPDYLDNALLPLWRQQVFKLPGGHFVNLDDPATFNQLLAAYCEEMFTANPVV